VPLGGAYAQRIGSLLELIDILDRHEARFTAMIAERLAAHRGYHAIQQLPGVGPGAGAVLVAEIGGVARFADPPHLGSWTGLTPTHRESDTVVRRGHITKRGSKLLRWAAVEAIPRRPGRVVEVVCGGAQRAHRGGLARAGWCRQRLRQPRRLGDKADAP